MTITILTIGSRGDIQPYIALGVELKKAGYGVRVATFETFETFVKHFGLEFYPVKGDVSRVASSEDVRGARQADNPLRVLFSFNKLKSYIFELQKELFQACKGSDAIVYHPGAAIGYFIARLQKVPSILATPFPMTPTREYPALIFYNGVRLGKGYNLVTHKIFEQIMWSATSTPIKQFWKQEFGHAPEEFGCPYGRQTTRSLPTIISCSDHIFPRPPDWPGHVHNTGYWFLDNDVDWKPPNELLDFLSRGTHPIYVGFGSIGDPTLAEQTTRVVIEALQSCGQRGLLATGWSGMHNSGDIPDDIFILESAPHSWLFPQMAAVVHHGGAGTTAAGLRAGIPNIIIPHGNDQFAWGRRVQELGVGPRPIPRKTLSAEKLSDAIQFALSNEVRANAKELGRKIQSENGAGMAAKVVIDTLEQRGDL